MCWYFDKDTLQGCTNKGIEVGHIELPLGDVKDIVVERVRNKSTDYDRTMTRDAIEPNSRGCFIVSTLVLCESHVRLMYYKWAHKT